MVRKNIGWLALCGCAVAVTVVVFRSGETMPRTAEAGSQRIAQAASPHVTSAAMPSQQIVSPAESATNTTQACQAVADQVVAIEQTIGDEQRSRQVKGLAPLDEFVAQ